MVLLLSRGERSLLLAAMTSTIMPRLMLFRKAYNVFYQGNNKKKGKYYKTKSLRPNNIQSMSGCDLSRMRRFFGKCTLIVVRRTMNNSKPCSRCLEMIKKCGIKKIYYSHDQGLVYEKARDMENDHVSSAHRVPWHQWNNQVGLNPKSREH